MIPPGGDASPDGPTPGVPNPRLWADAPAPTSPVAPRYGVGGTDGELLVAGTTDVPPELVGSFREYLTAWGRRVRGGDSGALPIIAGLILIVIIFQVQQSKFLSAGNLVNLLVQAAVFVLLGLAETFALLLSEIDLSIGYVAAVGAFIVAELMAAPYYWPWWAGGHRAHGDGGHRGPPGHAHHPPAVARLRGHPGRPARLAGGHDLFGRHRQDGGGRGDLHPPHQRRLRAGQRQHEHGGELDRPGRGLVLYSVYSLTRAARRRHSGLSAPPLTVTIALIGVVAVAGVALVWVCNLNRGVLVPLRGVPWVVPFILVVLVAWTVLLGRTRLGRYIYAIGANPEAARRAGVNVPLIRTAAFALCSFTAGLAGLVYESRLGSMATDIDGGTLVLYAVAAAVIGGTSLFGGKGKAVHALLGGLVIAAVYNGLGLLGVSAAGQDIATALVLLGAVTVDSLVRRRGTTRGQLNQAATQATSGNGRASASSTAGSPDGPATVTTVSGPGTTAERCR